MKQRGKTNGMKKTETAATVFLCTFGAFPEVHFLHAIYHFKSHEVKNPTLQTMYDLELKWGRYGLRKTTTSSHGNTISQGDFLHGAKFGHFAPWRKHLAKFLKVDLGTLRNAFEILCFSTHAPPTSQIFLALIFSRVNSFCNLVFSQNKPLSCNFAI